MSEAIVNRVSASGLISIDLETFLPKGRYAEFDLKDYLYMGLILKEKDFRESLRQHDWSVYADQYVAITCSADAVIPRWAYMLVVTYLQPIAKDVFAGSTLEMKKHLILKAVSQQDAGQWKDQRIVVKGCGDEAIGSDVYAEITKLLLPHVKSIMYGEPCSTVPVYKKKP